MAMASTVGDPEVREGFLCPMCMKDLGTVTQLQGHFEEEHSAEDKDVLQQLRGLFGKTIKKILGDKEGTASGGPGVITEEALKYTPAPSVAGYDPSLWDPQELGLTRTWTDMFKGIRGARVDRFVVETNKLIIRLDKLTGPDAPTDPNKRKVKPRGLPIQKKSLEYISPTVNAFERSIVPWIPDKLIPACHMCERSFSMFTRRHHCRLCGDIMCDKCSQFMPHTFAKKLTDPAFQLDGEVGFLKRGGSNTSLNSLVGSDGDPHIRTCRNCRQLLERRDKQVQQRNTRPAIVLLYERMRGCIQDSENLLETYMPMVETLSVGDSTHSLQTAQQYRAKIMKTYELIDGLSKRILMLGIDSENMPSAKQVQLQKSIRLYASNFMQENMIGLQSLPSEEQYLKLQSQRKQEIQQRIALERQATLEAQEREMRKREQKEQKDNSMNKSMSSQGSKSSSASKPSAAATSRSQGEERERSGSQILSGWIPTEETINFSDRDDPMIQQMNIIRGYIKQAKQAQKWDEVNMLEQNLKELKQEYLRQQKKDDWS